jgi:hypothetical protein
MSGESWRFRTARGVVSVRDDAISVRSTPGEFLAGQRRRWRAGDWRDRGRATLEVGGFLASIVGLVYQLSQVTGPGLGATTATLLAVVSHLVVLSITAYSIWSTHVGETTIPLSTVDVVTLDDDAMELVVVHEPEPGLGSLFRNDRIETTLSVPSREDLREAREIFRLRGIELRDPGDQGTETTYRVTVRDGACFCASCRSQVSPSDGTCPACGYAIRVRTGGDDTRERESERVPAVDAPS